MTLEEAINKASIILPQHKEDLISCLEHYPFRLAEWLYQREIVDPEALFQGDIVHDIPVCFIDEEGDAVKGIHTVSLISNTCDMELGREESIVVAPIVSFAELMESMPDKKSAIGLITSIKVNEIFSYFYLPRMGSLPEGYIDFSKMVSVNSDYLNKKKGDFPDKCVLSFSQKGYYLFLIKFTFFIARMESELERD